MAYQSQDIIRRSATNGLTPAPQARDFQEEVAKLIDVTTCIGCKACQVACSEWNDIRDTVGNNIGVYDNPNDLSAKSWTVMRFSEVEQNDKLEWLIRKDGCMHCSDPGCLKAGPALAVIENLEKASTQELEDMASALFASDFSSVSSDKAPFIWAALSLYWAQMANLIPGKARAEYGEQRQYCPVCGSMPVSSMVQIGTTQGLRYLHCNLCETEWHVVRVKCSNCEQSGKLHYWSLDDEQAAIKAESCDDCGTYLKILYQEKEPKVEAVADDLASLVLDARMEQEGYARSSINPFLFPGEGE